MKKAIIIIISIIILLVGGVIGWYYYNLNTAIGTSDKPLFFEVIEGEGTVEIAQNLMTKGFIRSALAFKIYVGVNNLKFLPGIYYLRDNMNIRQIAEPLSQGNTEENKIILIEGWRNTEIVSYFVKKGIVNEKEFLNLVANREGYLFPDTYRLKKDITAKELADKLLANFQKRTQGLNVKPEDVILASIVEREAKTNADRVKIAGVYKNRLSSGMKLDADPTVQYAKGNWEPLTKNDYESVKSSYNTYLNKGLPPSPICNPGLESIKAAINPQKSDYFYFFHLKNGTAIFSKTLEEHQASLEKYKNEL